MGSIQVNGFDWDEANCLKNLKKHGLSVETIEVFFKGSIWVSPDPVHSSKEERFLAAGKSESGKLMLVAFTLRVKAGQSLIRPISAPYMHAKEAKRYEQEIANI